MYFCFNQKQSPGSHSSSAPPHKCSRWFILTSACTRLYICHSCSRLTLCLYVLSLSSSLQGPTGPVGETGVPGPQGPQGPQGPSGRTIIGPPVCQTHREIIVHNMSTYSHIYLEYKTLSERKVYVCTLRSTSACHRGSTVLHYSVVFGGPF